MAVNQRCGQRVVKALLGVMAVCLAGYILGPPLYWHLMEAIAAVTRSSSSYYSCPPCTCDCNSQPLLAIPQGLSNTSFTDCGKHDPEVGEDTEKNFAELLSEELKSREAEASENQHKADIALLEAKKADISVYERSGQVQFWDGDLRGG